MTANDKELLACTRLYLYYFVVDNPHTPAALGLGLSSLYNHSPAANARYRISVKNEYLEIIACRSVSPGEEITLNYNGDPNDPSPVYFPGINMGHQLYIKTLKVKAGESFAGNPFCRMRS